MTKLRPETIAAKGGFDHDPATGAITGTPTAAGSFNAQLTLSDTTTTKVNISVPITVAGKLTVTTLRVPATKVGALFQATVRTHGGVAPIKWKVTTGKFPVGIRFDRRTGVLSGSARTAGVFRLTFTVTDSLGGTSKASYTLTVKAAKKPRVKT